MLQFHPINRYLLRLILVMLIVQIPKFYDQDEIEKYIPILFVYWCKVYLDRKAMEKVDRKIIEVLYHFSKTACNKQICSQM